MMKSAWRTGMALGAAALLTGSFMTLAEEPAAAAGQKATLVSSTQPAGTLDPSLANEVKAAINRSMDWLVTQQKEDGSWSDPKFPALTALALQAILDGDHPKKKEVVAKAVKYILSCVQKDGGIYVALPGLKDGGTKGGGLSNYNTAICMMALHAVGDPSLDKVIQNARTFVAGAQYLGDDVYKGGFGYDKQTDRPYTDLLNTYYSVEALKVTADKEDSRPATEKKVGINWNETVKFIEKMQNKADAGDQAGGFFYNPTDPKAGTSTNKDANVVIFRSFGSMTYAGMLALVHANVSRDDVRVKSAFEWAAAHWTLDENPGMGAQGVYFFYNILTKCLKAYGQDLVPIKDKEPLNWKAEVAKKLVSLQRIEPKNGEGYWKNDVNRYWEDNPVLTTAYTLRALEMVAK